MVPVRKTDPKIRDRIVELLRDGWTPQRIADEAGLGVSVDTIQRIAKAEGQAQPRGGGTGRPGRGGGRPKGSTGGGRPRVGEDMRLAVLALHGAGFGWAEIAAKLHLKSRQHAQQLAKLPDGDKGKT